MGITYDCYDTDSQFIFNKIEEKSDCVLKCIPLESGYSQEA